MTLRMAWVFHCRRGDPAGFWRIWDGPGRGDPVKWPGKGRTGKGRDRVEGRNDSEGNPVQRERGVTLPPARPRQRSDTGRHASMPPRTPVLRPLRPGLRRRWNTQDSAEWGGGVAKHPLTTAQLRARQGRLSLTWWRRRRTSNEPGKGVAPEDPATADSSTAVRQNPR